MDFLILGPLEVLAEGREVALGGSKQRALMAVLVLHANETLSTDRLIEELWGEQPPATAAKTVQVHVSRLRKALAGAGDLIVTREHGYRLELDPDRLDARRFERLVARARDELGADRAPDAAAALEEALALWRGEPLADLAYEPFVQREAGRLSDLRVAALELQIEAKLALGGHAEVIGQLEALIAEHPFREALRAQLMLALYRAERQADALQAYQNARRMLVEELGIEPGERLRELERAVLAQDESLALPLTRADEPPPAPVPVEPPRSAPTGPGARRLVSIVFADLVGSTGLGERLDPESMHALLDRYTEVCGAVIERHGGSVEGFIGDAVVGVFGLTDLHEDDALRAVRAAVELREEGALLSAELERERGVGIAMKFGVESGEVFLSAGARRSPFAAGDAFNVASRLENTAPEGEILIGETAYPLVRDFVSAEPLEPLELKGREAKVRAWRLLGLEADPQPAGSAGSPFVNRARELDELRAAFARARDDRSCRAVTVIGPAGIGKSRVVKELVAKLGADATVAVGRCQSYGEDVGYRPLADIVRQIGGDDPERHVVELLDGEQSIARVVLSAVGLAEAPAQPEEMHWAVRRLLERVASERPLVLIVDDVHWAEPSLLDLLDYLVAFSSGYPILLACIARPDFARTRPAWVTPQPNRSLMVVDALPDAEALRLVEEAGGGGSAAGRIVETAEGNPLFIEQLVAVGADAGESALPTSIQAVLAARIDSLAPGERAVLEAASVEGRSFHVGALEQLLDGAAEPGTAAQLVALVQQQLIRSDRSDLPGEDAFRFAHALIREAAYNGLPKQRRAELHERVARWLEGRAGARDETIGFHLAEAHRLLTELGLAGARERALATAAAVRLESAAGAALQRGDAHAGARLLERAATLMPADEPSRVALLPSLGAALLDAGRLGDADLVLAEAIDRAPAGSALQARARVEQQLVRLQAGTGAAADAVADSALDVLAAGGDELGQCRALWLRALHAWIEGRCGDADDHFRQAAEHAARAGDQAALFELLGWRASAALFGPTPVADGIRLCDEVREQVRSSPVAEARALQPTAALHAMAGDFEEARRLVRAADEILGELGDLHSAVAQQEALVEMLAGEPAAAEARLRAGYEQLERMGEKALLASTAAMLAQALYVQGRHDEAAELCDVSERASADDDISAQVAWRGVRAKLVAGDSWDDAHALAAEAVRLAEGTDFLTVHADALVDMAEVLRQGDRGSDADAALAGALELCERKGDVASAARVRALMGDR